MNVAVEHKKTRVSGHKPNTIDDNKELVLQQTTMSTDNKTDMVDIADLYTDDFVNARRSIDNVKQMFKHFSQKLPTKAKEDMVHAMCSLSIAIQEAIPEILGVRFHQQPPYKIISTSTGGDK